MPPSRPHVPEAAQPAAAPVVRPRQVVDGKLYQPVKPSVGVPVIEDPPEAAAGPYVVGAVPAGGPGEGVVGSLVDSIIRSAARPAIVPRPPEVAKAAPAPAAVAAPRRVAISSLEQGIPIRRIEPVYPPLALQARISGVVRLEGVIGTDGRIRELKVLGGHPLLVKAAVDAVSQWLYRPTILNGQPVEVVAPITVTFTMR
ncbi:MAG: energy transducer TonB, partial [Acidobacteriia bacterium]|nr:energy transducer TonB [Terriglobia bacterium]